MNLPRTISIVYSPAARETREWILDADESSTIAAIVEKAVLPDFPDLRIADLEVGIWGRITALSTKPKAGDRIEIYRPLTVDPKIARRKRFKSQGTRGAGLFAKKKVGKEAGY